MYQKENIGVRKKNREGLITADVTDVLRAINNNISWKNNSSKFTKTITSKNNTKNNNKNLMT
jgi:hypothetical protein